MSFSLCFWVLMLVSLVLGAWPTGPTPAQWRSRGFNLILFILLVLLGWKVFGAPLHS